MNNYQKPKCNQCDITFSNNKSLAVLHIKNFHENGKVLIKKQCEQCDEEFKLEKDLQTHILDVHKGWKCDQCDKCLKSIWYLKVHKQNHAKKIGENMEVSVNP